MTDKEAFEATITGQIDRIKMLKKEIAKSQVVLNRCIETLNLSELDIMVIDNLI